MSAPSAILAVILLGIGSVQAASFLDRFKKSEPAPAKPAPAAAHPSKQPQTIHFQSQIQPLLEKYCYDCHGDGMKKGGVSLDEYPNEAVLMNDHHTWDLVRQNVDQRLMPPKRKPQPTNQERELLAQWVEQEVFKVDCNNPDPGRVTIRRLNRAEYNNTLRDLLGIDFQPADDFPADDSGYGFDNIGDVLSMPPVLLEKYLAAADKALDLAIVTGPVKAPVRKIEAQKFSGGSPINTWARILASNGELFTNVEFPEAAEYILRVKAFGHQAGKDPVQMAIRLNGKDLKTVDVRAVETDPQFYDVRLKVEKGEHKVALAFLNDYYEPPTPQRRSARDRNLLVNFLEIEGPISTGPPPLPDTHQRIFTRVPTPDTKLDAAREILGNFARRAYRRPVQKHEVDRLLKLFQFAEQNGDSFEKAIKFTLQAVLVSPHFLFRGEIQPEPDNPRHVHPINEYALASRLSYFLWSSMPDEELFDLAGKRKLRQNLGYQVHRMLKDSKARAFGQNFSGQWLQTRDLDLVSVDHKMFPEFDSAMRELMKRETELFFDYIMRQNRDVLEFLTADYTFVNERLARHYGIAGVQGDEFQKVSLQGTQRSGVLTHGSILTITSNATRTSPVKRGLFVLENLLASPPPPPPPDVPQLPEDKQAVSTASLRERLELHRADPGCASCHDRMDPLGFGLENFNAIGAWREQDGGFPIDSSGELVTGEAFSGARQLNEILAQHKRKDFLHCLAEKMLTYALGRGLEYYDRCALDAIVQGVEQNQYRFSALVLEVVKSVPFQMRRGDGDRMAKN